jgi:hypothetical protein
MADDSYFGFTDMRDLSMCETGKYSVIAYKNSVHIFKITKAVLKSKGQNTENPSQVAVGVEKVLCGSRGRLSTKNEWS